MKKLLLALLALALLAALAVGIFIATFDADRYRPQAVKKIEEAIGRPVELDRIRLAWAGGIAIQLQGLRISDEPGAPEPLLAVESVSAVVRLSPLLHRRVEVASIIVKRPEVRVSRDAQGRINLTGLGAVASPAVPAASAAPAAPGGAAGAGNVSFEAERVRIEDGAVHWVDAAVRPPSDIWLRRIDVAAEPITPRSPVNVEARAALGGDRQNLRLAARVSLPLEGRPLVIEDLSFDADSPPLGSLMSGGWAPPVNSLRLRTSRVSPGEPVPLELEAAVASDRPNVTLTGRLLPPGPGAAGSFEQVKLRADSLPLDQLAPPAAGDAPRMRGRLSAAVEGSVPALAPASLAQTAAARGTIKIDEPVIENLNIIRTIFEKIAVLPGLVERLKARLPAEYQQKFEENDTRLEPVEFAAVYGQGVLRLRDLSIQSDVFGLSAPEAAITPDGGVQAQALLRIDQPFSEALIRSVEELRGLTNANGELELPIIVDGKPPHGIRPDLQYIGSRVVVGKAVEALGEWLGKGKEAQPAAGEGQPAEAAQPGASQAAPTGEELLGQFLQRALTPKNDQAPSQ